MDYFSVSYGNVDNAVISVELHSNSNTLEINTSDSK